MKCKRVMAVLIASALSCLSCSVANATEDYGNSVVASSDNPHGGTLMKNAVTGEVTYLTDDFSDNGLCDDVEVDSIDNDGGISTQAIIGSDDRQKITYPYNSSQFRSTVYVETHTADGGIYRGSGFMIGPNAVATAGHVVFAHGHGGDGWITYAKVIPALCSAVSGSGYYGYAEAIAYQCGANYANGESADDDWGIIILDRNIGNQTGWLDIASLSLSSYNNLSVKLNGYPAEVRGEYQEDLFMSTGTISSATSRTLTSYNIDCTGATSGGPCYYASNGQYKVIGICRGGSSDEATTPYTDFLRIDNWLYNKFTSFRNSTL